MRILLVKGSTNNCLYVIGSIANLGTVPSNRRKNRVIQFIPRTARETAARPAKPFSQGPDVLMDGAGRLISSDDTNKVEAFGFPPRNQDFVKFLFPLYSHQREKAWLALWHYRGSIGYTEPTASLTEETYAQSYRPSLCIWICR